MATRLDIQRSLKATTTDEECKQKSRDQIQIIYIIVTYIRLPLLGSTILLPQTAKPTKKFPSSPSPSKEMRLESPSKQTITGPPPIQAVDTSMFAHKESGLVCKDELNWEAAAREHDEYPKEIPPPPRGVMTYVPRVRLEAVPSITDITTACMRSDYTGIMKFWPSKFATLMKLDGFHWEADIVGKEHVKSISVDALDGPLWAGHVIELGPKMIKCLTFHTTMGHCGPYGREEGEFLITKER